MSNIPAFPNYLQLAPQDGMTLRDYLAAKALQGILSDPNVFVGEKYDAMTAKMAFDLADAMMAERDRRISEENFIGAI